MKTTKVQRKLYIVIAVLMIICLSLTCLTFAWFTDKVSIDDFVLNFGKIELETDTSAGTITTGSVSVTRNGTKVEYAMPGDKVEINITVKLTDDSQPAYYLVYFDGDDLFEYGSAFFFKSGTDIYAIVGELEDLALAKVNSDGSLTEVTVTEDSHVVGSISAGDTHQISFVQQIDPKATEDKLSGSKTFECTVYAIQQANMESEEVAFIEIYNLQKTQELASLCQLSEDGKYLYFGEYPQTLKANNVTIVSGPNASGYYTGSDGERYVKQVANLSEDTQEECDSLGQGVAKDGTAMTKGQEYYFKVEKLKWRVLSNDGSGNLMIVCDTAVQSMAYQPNYKLENSKYYATDESGNILTDSSGNKIYANNYEYSALREFLNGTFYSQAFSNKQKKLINLTIVDNNSTDEYGCNNTQDYVFALSEDELDDTNLGFSTERADPQNCFAVSDYSQATGAMVVTSEVLALFDISEGSENYTAYSFYLGSGEGYSRTACFTGNVYEGGHEVVCNGLFRVFFGGIDVYTGSVGVIPALQISLN